MTAPAPVLVTGGSGVVGGAVVRRLVADGRHVRALARSEAAASKVRDLGAEPVKGDVLHSSTLDPALDGCAAAYHVAGVNRFCVRDPSAMIAVNVGGSANVVEAAARAGVPRLVYTSSAAALGEAYGTIGREDSPHRGSFLSAYERSKFDAERVVLETGAREGVDVICLNPSSVQGPGRTTGTARLLVEYLKGRLKVWVNTTVSLVDIDDCAAAHVLAETNGRAGERYVLSAASLETPELVAVMAHVAPGVSPPYLVPRRLAASAVAVGEVLLRIRGRTPVVCRESMRTLLHGHRYDGSRAERELGVRYRPVEETLRRTAAWLAEQGLIPPSTTDVGGAAEPR